jgi:hypothetical protein
MSSLIFHTDQNQAFAATDTLAVSPNSAPLMFTTKAFAIPHLKMVICGTGAGGFLGKWFIEINDKMIVKGIDNLDFHTPKILSALWDSYRKEFSPSEKQTTTVYHFGLSEEDGFIHTYAYRSTGNFKSEPLAYGVGYKPECKISEGYGFPTDIKKIMDEQRSIQLSKPKDERVYIGGEIQIFHLTKDGINIYTLAKFDDYSDTEKEIYSNYEVDKI